MTRKIKQKGRDTLKANTKKKDRSFILAFVFSLVLLIAFVFAYYTAYQTYWQSEQKVTASHFSDMANGGRTLVRSYFDRLTDNAKASAQILSYLTPKEDALNTYFQKELPKQGAVGASIRTEDGTILYDGFGSYTDSGFLMQDRVGTDTQMSTSLSETFSRTVGSAFQESGGYAISDLQFCGSEQYFCIAVPAALKDGRSAVLAIFYPRSVLDKLMDTAQTSESSRLCMMDSSGNFIAMQTTWEPWVTADQFMLDSEASNRLTTVTSLKNGEKYVVYAKSIGLSDWYIIYAMPQTVLEAQIQAGSDRIHLFGTGCLIFIVFVFGVGLYRNHLRYRKLELFKEKFRIATLQSARAAFEYDKKRDSIHLISECEHVHFPKEYMSLSELVACVHPADRALYGQAVIELRRDNVTSTNVRCIHMANDDTYRWYHVTATRLANRGAGRALTIGTVEDIDENENERLLLMQRATTDCLTGLNNRAETEQRICERLAELGDGDHSAFAILDLDDFKRINDIYGHDCGDRALIFFAERLRATFRYGDVIGRLGGDEFVVYMTLTSDKKVLLHRIEELMDSLKMSRCDDEEIPAITCSVGCCIASQGDTFEDLYKTADAALYESKTKGKGFATVV